MGVGVNTSQGTVRSSVGPPLPRTTTLSSNIVSTTNKTTTTTTTISPREQIKIEFYRTYDVMTGIRIAATLGGFFSLMVILIVYKSKSKTDEALKDPKLAAAAVAEAEEEEQRQIQAVVEATFFEQLHPNVPRRSIDLNSLPVSWARTARRLSSIGGYSTLLERRSQFSSQLPSFDDEESAGDEERTEFDDEFSYSRCLEVPRRPSNITCSSSGSSYLERRSSSILLGFPAAIPVQKSNSRRRQSSPVIEKNELYYPIDIRVIQPTPRGSPCSSERTLYNTVPPPPRSPCTPKRAPLASISSCNTSLSTDYPDFDANSFYSDVFQDDSFVETENEAENFSTDSEIDIEEKQQSKSAAMKSWKEKRKRFAGKRLSTSSERRTSVDHRSSSRKKYSEGDEPYTTTSPYLSVDYGMEGRRLSASVVEASKRSKFSRRRPSLNEKPFRPSYKFLSIDRQPSLEEGKIYSTSFNINEKSAEKLSDNCVSSGNPSTSDKATNVSEAKLDAFTCINITTDHQDPSCSFEHSKSSNGQSVTKRHSSLSLPSSCKSSVSLLSPMNSEESATVTLPTLPLRQRSTSTTLEKRTSWSQETLF